MSKKCLLTFRSPHHLLIKCHRIFAMRDQLRSKCHETLQLRNCCRKKCQEKRALFGSSCPALTKALPSMIVCFQGKEPLRSWSPWWKSLPGMSFKARHHILLQRRPGATLSFRCAVLLPFLRVAPCHRGRLARDLFLWLFAFWSFASFSLPPATSSVPFFFLCLESDPLLRCCHYFNDTWESKSFKRGVKTINEITTTEDANSHDAQKQAQHLIDNILVANTHSRIKLRRIRWCRKYDFHLRTVGAISCWGSRKILRMCSDIRREFCVIGNW